MGFGWKVVKRLPVCRTGPAKCASLVDLIAVVLIGVVFVPVFLIACAVWWFGTVFGIYFWDALLCFSLPAEKLWSLLTLTCWSKDIQSDAFDSLDQTSETIRKILLDSFLQNLPSCIRIFGLERCLYQDDMLTVHTVNI